jgi:hypothetical protein
MTSVPDPLAVPALTGWWSPVVGVVTRNASVRDWLSAVCVALIPLTIAAAILRYRRFDRRRYDAARTIEASSVRLRQQVDLGALRTELLAVVEQTMQPTRASLWLRPAPDEPPA